MRSIGLFPHARKSADHARSSNLGPNTIQTPPRPFSSSAVTQRTETQFHHRLQPPLSPAPSHYVPSLYNNQAGYESTPPPRFTSGDIPQRLPHGHRELYQDEVGSTRYTPRLYNEHEILRDGASMEGSREAREEAERRQRRPSHGHRELYQDELGTTRYTPRLYNENEVLESSGSRDGSREGREENGAYSSSVARVDAYGYVITDQDERRAVSAHVVQDSVEVGEEAPPSYETATALQ